MEGITSLASAFVSRQELVIRHCYDRQAGRGGLPAFQLAPSQGLYIPNAAVCEALGWRSEGGLIAGWTL